MTQGGRALTSGKALRLEGAASKSPERALILADLVGVKVDEVITHPWKQARIRWALLLLIP
jgi:hypothetical protein